ncbi:MAG: ECF transporter S component [Crenarchaeota archaeon]|nr:ECF transporter S component [Thermoproteota archaeon]MDW8033464.1 ECF transporter S component [Nitrososphaerota archaeon]
MSTQNSKSLLVTTTALCAALYAVGCYATAYIPSPWGFGQFRPAVVIPALFGIVFGPFPSALGAAMGTLIADSAKHGSLHIGSLIAAVPGNFIGFYIYGRIMGKGLNWSRFITASLLALIIGNAVVAFLYVFFYRALFLHALPFSIETLTFVSIGLTIYWFATMLPFMLLITPLLIRMVAVAMPGIVPKYLRFSSIRTEFPRRSFMLATIIPGVILLLLGVATSLTPLKDFTLSAAKLSSTLLIELTYYCAGLVLTTMGVAIQVKK